MVVPSSPTRVCAQPLIRALPQLGYIERCGMLMMVIMRPIAGDGVMVYVYPELRLTTLSKLRDQ